MKTKLTLLLVLIIAPAIADDQQYIEIMKKNIDLLYQAKSVEAYQESINAFERIGTTEKSKWEPFYYSSLGYVLIATLEKDLAKKDQWLDLSSADLEKAKAINGKDSEVIAMEGFIHMLRVTVDPATRGAQYSGMASASFGKALALNPDNPRALMLLAQMQFGTARHFNGPITEACATVNKALEKFETFIAPGPIAPTWGKEPTVALMANCK